MKKKGILALLLACSFALGTASMTGCNLIGGSGEGGTDTEQGGDTTVAVKGVSLNKNVLNLGIDGTETLTATIAPTGATDKTVTWSSDNEEVATVDQQGNVTAHATGTAIITVTTTSGGKTASCTVTVTENEPEPVRVESVSLNKNKTTLKVNETETLTVSFNPASPDNKNVTWTSGTPTVATVDQSGKVTAASVGKTIITVTTEDGNKTAQCEVTVEAAAVATVPVTGVTVTPAVTIKEGATSQLTCTVSPANASDSAVTWASGNPSVATVDGNGLVTAVAEGTAIITVTSVANNSFKATCTVTVEKVSQPVVDAEITYSYAGNECAAFEWSDSDPANANTNANVKVEYKLKSSSSYTALSDTDKKYLVRQKNATTARVDLVGLKGGETYDFKITTSAKKVLTASDVTIHSYDRSGYAHFGKSDGVGAYNNDGTPKNNAVIVYVNEANKNTVTANGQTGIVNILKNAGTTKPLIVRIVGTVGAATWNELAETTKDKDGNYIPILPEQVVGKDGQNMVSKYVSDRTERKEDGSIKDKNGEFYHKGTSVDISQATLIKDGFNTLNTTVYSELNNLNSKIKYDASKDEFDSCWNDCSISGVKNVTVEGVGEDAKIFQWGMTFKNSSSIEVRNLTFDDYTEDACSFEGSETGASSLSDFKSGNIWVHHNTFEEGINYWDVCNEQDKHDGDGSTDFKGLKNITLSYNVYNGTHKTGLIGGDNKHTTANVTFHHNAYNGCKSRLPLARQANMHMYNNYYNGTTGTDISLRAGAYALVENCYFSSTKSVNFDMQHDSSNGDGAAKVIGCTFAKKNVNYASGFDKSYFKEDVARDATISNDNKFSKTFDTDSSVFYYDSVNKKSNVSVMLTAEQTKQYVPELAGVQKHGGDVTLGGAGGGSGTGTGTGGGETGNSRTVLVINDFSKASGKEYTLSPSTDAAEYFDSTVKLYIYVDNDQKSISTTKDYIKLESATKIKFVTTSQLPAGAKLVLTMGDLTGVEASKYPTSVKVNDSNIDIVDNKVTVDLTSGTTYILGRVSGETRIASISIIIPAQ